MIIIFPKRKWNKSKWTKSVDRTKDRWNVDRMQYLLGVRSVTVRSCGRFPFWETDIRQWNRDGRSAIVFIWQNTLWSRFEKGRAFSRSIRKESKVIQVSDWQWRIYVRWQEGGRSNIKAKLKLTESNNCNGRWWWWSPITFPPLSRPFEGSSIITYPEIERVIATNDYLLGNLLQQLKETFGATISLARAFSVDVP